jgi:hypothetical protein
MIGEYSHTAGQIEEALATLKASLGPTPFFAPPAKEGEETVGPHAYIIGRFRCIARVKCPYRVADKASALGAGNRAPG